MTDDPKGLVAEQVDREAAANNILKQLIFAHGGIQSWMPAAVRSIRNGEQDDHDDVQAFASHRIEATAAKDAEIYNLTRYQADLRTELEHARECATKAEAELETANARYERLDKIHKEDVAKLKSWVDNAPSKIASLEAELETCREALREAETHWQAFKKGFLEKYGAWPTPSIDALQKLNWLFKALRTAPTTGAAG